MAVKKEEFHTVEFMRKRRAELSAEYEKDPDAYFKRLEKVMDDFKKRQAKQNRKAA